MKKALSRLYSLGMRTYRVFLDTDMVVYSAYATLYILMAMIPMSLLVVSAVGLLPEAFLKGFEEAVISLFPSVPQVQSLVSGTLSNLKGSAGAVLLSVTALSLLWSAATGVNAIQLALSIICGSRLPALKRRAASLLYTLVFIILIPILVIFRVLRGSIEQMVVHLGELLKMPELAESIVDVFENSGLISFLAMLLIILLAYIFLPGKGIRRWKQQLPGAGFTALLWVLFSALFDFFITRFWNASFLYGSLASIFLLALWMKTIVTILFLGASLNQALLELGYWKEADALGEADLNGRSILCVYLLIAMLVLACVMGAWLL